MRKSILSLALAITSVFALSSCHSVILNSKFEIPENFNENKDYTISFWAKNDSDNTQIAIYQKAIEDFNEYYPNIHVELRNFASYPDIYREVLLNMSTNSTPNVCISYPDNVATYIENSYSVVALTDLLTDEKYGLSGTAVKYPTIGEGGIVSKFLEEGKITAEVEVETEEGKQKVKQTDYYTIPFMRSTEALYINKTYVERLGFEVPSVPTWDWLWEVCEAAVEERYDDEGNDVTAITTKVDPSKDFHPLIYKSSDNWFIQYAKQAGIDYTNKDGEILMFNEDTTSYLLDLKQKCMDGLYEVFSNTSHYPGDLINVWDTVFGIDSTAGATWIGYGSSHGTSSLGYEEFETKLTVIPQIDTNNIEMISQGPSICVFNKPNNEEVLASWLFAQFLLSDSVQMEYQKTEGYIPVTNNVLNSKEYKDYLNGDEICSTAKQAKELLMNHLDDTFITPVFNGSANIRIASGQLINSVGNTKATPTTFSTPEGISKLYALVIKNNSLEDLVNANKINKDTKIGTSGTIVLSVIGGVWLCIGAYILYDKRDILLKKRIRRIE